MDYYQILGVNRNCEKEALHQKFRELSKTYHPDRFSETERRNAEQRYQEIVKAFNTLKDKSLREKYDKLLQKSYTRSSGTFTRKDASKKDTVGNERPSQAAAVNQQAAPIEDNREMAQKYFKAGMKKFHQMAFDQAIECFKRSVHYHPTAEAFFQKGMAETKERRFHKESVQSMQKAIQLNGKKVEYRLQLARTLVHFGMNTRAKTVVEAGLSVFPEDKELLDLDHQLNPDKYKKRTLGGIFGGFLSKK